MIKVQIIFSAILLILSAPAAAKIWINEFMQSNIDGIRDDLNQFPDSWVELYNDSDSLENIQNWYISDNSSYLRGWRIPHSVPIPAKGYQLIYCDKEATGLHTHFRLESGSGGAIYLFNASGTLVDGVVNIPAQPAPNIARGRTADAGNTWAYFITPTPDKKNEGETSNILLPDLIFDPKGGMYNEEEIWITLSLPPSAPANISISDIRYTTDGSEPTENSPQYQKAIAIDKTTPLRAKIIAPEYLINRSVTHTYIIPGRKLTLPVVSINLDPEYLWDSNFGMYVTGPGGLDDCRDKRVNWNNDWRRPMNIEYFPSANEPVAINQLAEMRIGGGCSRGEPLKSLILYANKRFGQKRFDYQLFKDKQGQELKSIMIRNSGNDFWETHFRDAAIQLFMGGKVDLDYQAYQPAIIYINGEYFGIENIRERSQEDFVFGNYDGLSDIDLIENWVLEDWWGRVKTGDKTEFDYMMSELKRGNTAIAMNLVDTDEYINYMILQIYVHNFDFPMNNNILWRPKTENGKWRFILKDLDFGLGLHDWAWAQPNSNSMVLNTLPNNPTASDIESRRVFNALLEQPLFREKFYSRFAIYMGDLLHYNSTSQIIDSIRNMLAPEMPYHLDRWSASKGSKSISSWNNDVNIMKNWCQKRNQYMYDFLNTFFELRGTVPMLLDISEELKEIGVTPTVFINDVALQRPYFEGKYFLGEDIRLHCTWNKKLFPIGCRIEAKLKSGGNIEPIEFFALEPEYTIPQDCIDLKITLIKDPNVTLDFEAPSIPQNVQASELTSISFELSWDSSTDNVEVTGYEVYKNGELYETTRNTTIAITNLTPRTSYKIKIRAFDAAENFSEFGEELLVTTMNNINVNDIVTANGEFTIYPNPAKDAVFIVWNNSCETSNVSIYNSSGKLQRSFNSMPKGSLIDISSYVSGCYLIKVENNSGVCVKQLIIEK